MKIAIAGKGGSGKTTIAGTLARQLSRQGVHDVLAIDADSNPNLGITLGMPRDHLRSVRPLTRDVLEKVTDEQGNVKSVLAKSPEDVIGEYGIRAHDDVTMVLMGRVEHAGAG